MAAAVHIFSRIVYGFVYTLLYLILLALMIVTPADIINQSRDRHDVVSILIVAGAYVFSILVVFFVYFLRLFLSRGVLNSIPKSWIPIEKGEVRKQVRKMIGAGLSRSAAVAFVSRPRIVPQELLEEMCPIIATGAFMSGGGGDPPAAEEEKEDRTADGAGEYGEAEAATGGGGGKRDKVVRFKRTETVEMEKELGINLPPCLAVWGEIEHPGWAPPSQPMAGVGGGLMDEILDLQYSTVVEELPNLVEAKALTLAPPDPTSQSKPPLLDAEAVALLQRPVCMGLRDYLGHLAELGVIDLHDRGVGDEVRGADGDRRPLSVVVSSFVATYEYARYSTQMLSHDAFRQLMHDLATILRRMASLDPNLLLDDGDDDYDDYDKEAAYSYSEADNRSGKPYFADSEEEDIDNNAARSSPTTPPRSRSRRSSANRLGRLQQQQQQQQGYEAAPRSASQSTRSRSASSKYSTCTSSTGSSQRSNGTSRRRRSSRRRPHGRSASPSLAAAEASSAAASKYKRRGEGAQKVEQPSLQPQGQTKPPKVRRKAPTGPRTPRRPSSDSSSANSFAQTRHPYTVSSQPSSASLRSTASSGSVIRLADRSEQSLGLPYVIMTPTSSLPDERLF